MKRTHVKRVLGVRGKQKNLIVSQRLFDKVIGELEPCLRFQKRIVFGVEGVENLVLPVSSGRLIINGQSLIRVDLVRSILKENP